ncbi:MAG: hypothetical protein ABI579_05870, partial [Candidatus Sumerlaeota bacterium]
VETASAASSGEFQISLLKMSADQPFATCEFAQDASEESLPLSLPIDTTDGPNLAGISCAVGIGGAERWVKLPPLDSGKYYTVSTGIAPGVGEQDTRLEVFAGPDCSALVSLGCNDDVSDASALSQVMILGADGVDHWVMVESAISASEGPFVLSVDAGRTVSAGSVCETAVDLTSVSLPHTRLVNLAGVESIRDTDCTQNPGSPEQWFRITGLADNVIYSVDTAQSAGNPVPTTSIQVFTGDCGELKSVACDGNNNPSGSGLTRIEFQGDSTKTFWVMVEGQATGATNQFLMIVAQSSVLTPAANDTCGSAEDIDSVTLPPALTADMRAAQDDGYYLPTGYPTGGRDVFYYFTPRVSGRYRFSASAVDEGNSLGLGIWTGPNCNTLSPLCSQPTVAQAPVVSAYLTSGEDYLIILDDADPDTRPSSYQLLVESETSGAPALNSVCSGATVVSALPFSATQDSRPGIGVLEIASGLGGDTCQGELYFRYTPTANITVNAIASLAGGEAAAIRLYTGACAGLVAVSDPLRGEARYHLQAAVPYTIAVEPIRNTDTGSLTFSLTSVTSPGNDGCSGAPSAIIAAVPYAAQLDMNNAADEGIESPCVAIDATGPRRDLFFAFTPTTSGNYRIDAGTPGERDSSPDTVISVYTGACASLQSVACRNASQAGEFLTLQMTAGTAYTLQVESDGENSTAPIDLIPFSVALVPNPSSGSLCASAVDLTNDDLPFAESVDLSGNNASSPRENGGPAKAYRVSSSGRGRVTVTATPGSSDNDVYLAAYTNVCDFRYVNWYTNDENTSTKDAAAGGAGESLVFEIQANEPAIVYVEDKNGEGGTMNVQISIEDLADRTVWMVK